MAIRYVDIIAVITLPEAAFGNKHNMKSIFVLKNKLKMLQRPSFIHLHLQNPGDPFP